MEWITDPTLLLGFFTLVLLEIILGIDNLIFIAIVADKLPPEQADKARTIGLSLALIMRIALLGAITWLTTLTAPWVHINGIDFSARDLILLGGGLFLLCKATTELHSRMEGRNHQKDFKSKVNVSFWGVITQIIILDAVFSIDSVITAVGMANDIEIMIAAVVVAVIVMLIASKPLTVFVNAHPTLIMLCLGFLLMIGLSLIMEGFGAHIPKGYLYAAMGFSLTVETFNQLARFNRKNILMDQHPPREQLAEAVQGLLGGKTELQSDDLAVIASANKGKMIFNKEEREMIQGVINMAEVDIKEIMLPRSKLDVIDITKGKEMMSKNISNSPFSRLVIIDKDHANPLGYIQKKELADLLIVGKEIIFESIIHQPLMIKENKTILGVLKGFKKSGIQMAFIFNEQNSFMGIVTLTDIMEFIAGDIPEEFEVGK